MNQTWVNVATSDAVPDGEVIAVEAEGREIALYAVDGAFYATDNICTHGHARLCDGYLDGYEIECPLHQGAFDIRSGKALCAPVTEDIRSYPVKIEDGKVFLAFD
jgi:naphthalene 1,2-dioxygenase system ferredoxin subunit